jgi:hypothetical protein
MLLAQPLLVVAAWVIRVGLSASFAGAAAARQSLDALDLFDRLLIKGGVAEVNVPVQARVLVVLVMIFGSWVR